MQVVCNIEKNNQMILHQIHSLFLMVGQLSQ